MSTALYVLPALLPERAVPCIESFAPELKHELVVVDNGQLFANTNGALGARWLWHVSSNRGVSWAWNRGRAMAIAQGVDWLVIVSEAITWHDGGRSFRNAMDVAKPKISVLGGLYAWHLVAIRVPVLIEVGEFDEQFFAYMEDQDYIYRMRLAGYGDETWDYDEETAYTVDCGPNAGALLSGKVEVSFGELVEKYVAKWGGEASREVFTVPYDGAKT